MRGVLGDYFRAIGIPLIAGRAFTARDDSTAPRVIVINRSLATRYFGSAAAAVGQRLRINGYPLNAQTAWEIIGVAGDVKTGRLDAAAPLTIYWPDLQAAENRVSLVLRTGGAPVVVAAQIRAQVRALIEEHQNETGSDLAQELLTQWDLEIGKFWQVVPREMLARLPYPLSDEAEKIPAE